MSVRTDIANALWGGVDSLRGITELPRAISCVVALLVVKVLSDSNQQKLEEYRRKYAADEERIARAMSREPFVVPEACSFDRVYTERGADNLGERINGMLSGLEAGNQRKLGGVFAGIDFNSPDLGVPEKRNPALRDLLEVFNKLDLRAPGDLALFEELGERFFQHEAPFSSSRELMELMVRLADPLPGDRIYDPACGTGSLLAHAARFVKSENFALYGHEPNRSKWALCQMSLTAQGLNATRIVNADPFRKPILEQGDEIRKFNVVMTVPPFSLSDWGAQEAQQDPFNRFRRGVPPANCGDYAFITQAVESMDSHGGRACVVVPLGVLFRGGSEGVIRQRLVEENLLDGVVRLPSSLFVGTPIRVALMLFRKNKPDRSVLFLDASLGGDNGKSGSRLQDAQLDRIVSTWQSRKALPKYSQVVTCEDIAAKKFNLNVPLYVRPSSEELGEYDRVEADIRVRHLEEELGQARTRLSRALTELAQPGDRS